MEAGTLAAAGERASVLARARSAASNHPALVFLAILLLIALALIVSEGLRPFAQVSVNGLVAGSYFALGAIGLTLVYGILKLVNFAHGDMLTLGAYVAFLFNVSIGMPLVAALLIAIAATAAVGVFLEGAMWRPMRRRKAGMLQLLLMAIGLAFVIRNAIQFIAGTAPRTLDVDRTTAISFLDLTIGRTQLIVLVTGIVVLLAVALMLRYTSLGRQMRALSDNFDLAETTGINTGRVVIVTWILAAGLAGLAGVLVVAATGSLTPNTGFQLLLPIFAAVILGGIGNAYGALAGGLVLGLSQEWSTLLLPAQWKIAVGFAVLILVLVFRPQGIFGRARTL
jgi:neutral amino acid transport system permease protein